MYKLIVHLYGHAIMKMTKMLAPIAGKLKDEVAHSKSNNVKL